MKSILIRVSEDIHASIKEKAWQARKSMNQYILDCVADGMMARGDSWNSGGSESHIVGFKDDVEITCPASGPDVELGWGKPKKEIPNASKPYAGVTEKMKCGKCSTEDFKDKKWIANKDTIWCGDCFDKPKKEKKFKPYTKDMQLGKKKK